LGDPPRALLKNPTTLVAIGFFLAQKLKRQYNNDLATKERDMSISWINEAPTVVDYSEQAVAEYEQGMGNRINEYTDRFEQEFGVSGGEDIGGLIVYRGGKVVYDYENFCGWVK
jgi:hypothetical protein